MPMHRDMDLIRDLMLRFERNDYSIPQDRTKAEVAYHAKQLIDAGFLVGQIISTPSPGKLEPTAFIIQDLTWKGHDFIETVLENTVWQRAKEHFVEKAVPWTADLILEFLKSKGREALGL